MSFNPEAAFNKVLALQARTVTLHDISAALQVTVKAAPSNYFRNLAGPEETTSTGREFVISKKALDEVSFPAPTRGVKLIDAEWGYCTITAVREMVILGKIVGYRVRAD
jgi:hypothetical protein